MKEMNVQRHITLLLHPDEEWFKNPSGQMQSRAVFKSRRMDSQGMYLQQADHNSKSRVTLRLCDTCQLCKGCIINICSADAEIPMPRCHACKISSMKYHWHNQEPLSLCCDNSLGVTDRVCAHVCVYSSFFLWWQHWKCVTNCRQKMTWNEISSEIEFRQLLHSYCKDLLSAVWHEVQSHSFPCFHSHYTLIIWSFFTK